MRLVTAAEMRSIEIAAEAGGIDRSILLVQAGTAIANRLAALHGRDRTATVLVGKGNNGGDALVAARRLTSAYGWDMTIGVASSRAPDGHLDALQSPDLASRVRIKRIGAHAGADAMDAIDQALSSSAVVVDGLLGIGATGPLRGDVEAILARCAAASRTPGQAWIAIDIASGVDADTGKAALGAFRATRTLSTGPAKPGCFVGEGATLAGYVDVLDIGLPDLAWTRHEPRGVPDDGTIHRVGGREAAAILPARPDHSYKGSFGRVLVVGGCGLYPGAPALSALGAIHGGAGVVTVARPGRATDASWPPEVVSAPMASDGTSFAISDVDRVVEVATRMRALVVGPGLGSEGSTREAVRTLMAALPFAVPLVVDADGLNALVGTMDGRNAPWVVTPHAAEMARLTGLSIEAVLRDPIGVAREAARRWGVVVVLKGAPTVVASPGLSVAVGAHTNAALATAGSGDVLAGLIGALLAQGASPWHGAVAGVTVHAVAAELWRRDHGSAGARAADLAARLPDARRLVTLMA
ncbi:MAG: NAD(P)H-hydrate dehydratase [Chloroflexota bacterium]